MNAHNRDITRDQRLHQGVANLGTGAMTINICAGEAWITQGNEDFIVQAGQALELRPSMYSVLLSSTDEAQSVVFQVDSTGSHWRGFSFHVSHKMTNPRWITSAQERRFVK